jgi:hypothetical protein
MQATLAEAQLYISQNPSKFALEFGQSKSNKSNKWLIRYSMKI